MRKEYWLPEGSLLHEKYSIKKGLGEGGFAITYLAYDTTLQQDVAIKEYFPIQYANRLSSRLNKNENEKLQVTDDKDFKLSAASMVYPQNGQEEKYLKEMRNFLREARMLFGKFDIEGIVSVKDFFEENGTAYIVMEYLSGLTLREYERKNRGKVSEEQAYILLEPIVKALSYLHSIDIVHCDISPDNLLFDKEGKLKLIDFGVAKTRKKQKEKQKEEIYYKGSYTPPEQYYDMEQIGPWTDIYALCSVWYELITGNQVPMAMERMEKDRIKLVSAITAVSSQTEEILYRGLSLEIPKRYFSAVNLYFDMRKAERYIRKTNISTQQTEKNIGQTAPKEDTELEKYMTDTRKNWGDLWLQITTDVNEKNITQKGRWLSKKRIRCGMQAVVAIILLILLAGSMREVYIRKYPERYFASKVKRNKEFYLLHSRKNEYTNKMPEYQERLKRIRDLAYKAEEEPEKSYYQYEISEKNLKELKLISNKTGILYLSEADMEKAVMTFMNIKEKDTESVSISYQNKITQRGWGKERELEVAAQKQKNITYANRERVKIAYDPVDECVYEVAFTGRFGRAKSFVECMQPVLCPENYLTSTEVARIFSSLKKSKNWQDEYQTGPDYEIEVTKDDNEDNPYVEYTAIIRTDSFDDTIY